jgi:hypothetical protein
MNNGERAINDGRALVHSESGRREAPVTSARAPAQGLRRESGGRGSVRSGESSVNGESALLQRESRH